MIRTFAPLSLLVLAAAANAADIKFFGADMTFTRDVRISYLGQNSHVYAGPLKVAVDGGSQFSAYCVDLAHSISSGDQWSVTVTSTSDPSLNNGVRLGQIYNKYAGSVSSKDEGAALQLALWDVWADGGDGFSSGAFRATSISASVTALFSAIVADPLTGISSFTNYYKADFHGPNNDRNQNLIGGTPPNATPVPEPASMAVIGLGLAALRRRRAVK